MVRCAVAGKWSMVSVGLWVAGDARCGLWVVHDCWLW